MFVARRVNRKSVRRRLNRSREVSLILFICAALSMVFLLFFGDSGYLELQKKEREIRSLEMRRDEHMEQNRKLALEIEDLRTDSKRIEKQAREELKLGRENEIIILLKDPPKKQAPNR